MDRAAMKKLIEWKNKKNRKPLVIMGARQVGKTWLMREFGKHYYEKVAYISFYNNERMRSIFETDFDINRILAAINIEAGVTVEKENAEAVGLDVWQFRISRQSLK